MDQTSQSLNKELTTLLSRAIAFEKQQERIAAAEFGNFRDTPHPKGWTRISGMGTEERRAMRRYTYHGVRVQLFEKTKAELIKKIEDLEKMVR